MIDSRFSVAYKLARNPRFTKYLNDEYVNPIQVEISLSPYCNAGCPTCLYRKYENKFKYSKENTEGYLPTEKVFALIDELNRMNVLAVTWSGGGEPTLHPDFKIISKYTHDNGILQGLFTNALLPVEYDASLFEWVRITLSKGKEIPADNLKILRVCKTLGICVNVTFNNDPEVKRALLLKDHFDYVQVRPALKGGSGFINVSEWAEIDKKIVFSNHKFIDGKLEKPYCYCTGFHFVPFIWEDGEINVCAYQRGVEGYALGNISEGFEKVMRRAPDYVPVRRDCQTCCKNHEINKFIMACVHVKDRYFV